MEVFFLQSSEHMVVVLSKRALSSLWVHEEVSWWLSRRGWIDVTVLALDDSKAAQLHADLASAALFNFSQRKLFGQRLKSALASSGWLRIP